MAATFNKTYLTLPQQIALLKSRGLQIADEKAAEECLHRNGYYRMSAYWYPFRVRASQLGKNGRVRYRATDGFRSDSSFEDALALYVFDKKLKLLLMDAIERVEIAVRVEIALCLGQHDIYAHTNSKFFRSNHKIPDPTDRNNRTKHEKWLDRFQEAVDRSRDEFVLHHERKYGSRSPLPIWMAIELWDFGRLSFFYSGMDTIHRVSVANRFSIPHRDILESWLICLNYVRNVIAHHGRLWNLNLADNPKLPRRGQIPEFNPLIALPNVNVRIYSVCCILAYFSKVINPQSTWPSQLADLIRQFPKMPHATIQEMGFPVDWEDHSFWN